MTTEVIITPSMDWTASIVSVSAATGVSEEEAEAAIKKAVEVYRYRPTHEAVIQLATETLKRAFRNKDYVTSRGKKMISRGVSRSGGTCSRSYALNYERNMVARNPKAKLPGKIRRALEDF